MTDPLTCTELVMTCEACPSQWEGVLSDGRHLYCRYRWGSLSIGVGVNPDAAVENSFCHDLTLGDDYDGTMSTDALQPYLAAFLDRLEAS